MPYQLQLHCPIAWPDHPPYPIDSFTNGQASTGLPTSEAQQDVQDPPSVDKVWLRQLYLKALYGLGDLQESDILSRVDTFANALRAWLPPIPPEILVTGTERLQTLDQRWRFDIPKLLQAEDEHSPVGILIAEDENSALASAHEQWKWHNDQVKREITDHSQERGKARLSFREWLGELELLSHQLQIILVGELLAADGPELLPRDEPPADASSVDYEALFDLLTDRLAMHQALNGISDMLNDDSGKGAELDDVQAFWRFVFVKHYGHIFPKQFLALHAEKIFTEQLNQDMFDEDGSKSDSEEAALPLPLPRATPEMVRLARSMRVAAKENAIKEAAAIPPSPTLAKLLGRPKNASTMQQQGQSKLKRSTSATALPFAGRQVSMGLPKRSVSVETDIAGLQMKGGNTRGDTVNKQKQRTSKRKQASPKKFAATSRTLVMATPAKRSAFSRALSAPNFKTDGPFADTNARMSSIHEESAMPVGVLALETPDAAARKQSQIQQDLLLRSIGQTPVPKSQESEVY